MWPIDLLLSTAGPEHGTAESVSVWRELLAGFGEFTLLEQAAIQGVGTLLVGLLVVGLLRQYGTDTLSVSRRSPVISLCIGVPAVLVVAGLFYTGLLLSNSNLGVFFAIPLVTMGALVLPAAVACGYAAIGGSIATRLGITQVVGWIAVGAVLSALTALAYPIGFVLTGFASALGLGAAIRVLFRGGGLEQPEDRVVPPANKI